MYFTSSYLHAQYLSHRLVVLHLWHLSRQCDMYRDHEDMSGLILDTIMDDGEHALPQPCFGHDYWLPASVLLGPWSRTESHPYQPQKLCQATLADRQTLHA